jgi:hypothetical protein
MASYPVTPQQAVDRLLIDREFLIRTVVEDNFPAVHAQFLAQLQDDPRPIRTPEMLVQQLLWWDQNHGPELVDPVLSVPWRGSVGSQALNGAFTQMEEMNRTTGTGGQKFWGAVIGLVGNVAGLLGSGAQAQASQQAAEAARQQAVAAEAARKAQNDKFLRIGIVVASIALLIIGIYLIRKN